MTHSARYVWLCVAERCVISFVQKYYPIDFEFFKLPKLEKGRPKQYVVRLMAPFTMRWVQAHWQPC